MALKVQGTTVVDNDRSIKNAFTIYQSSDNNAVFWGNAKTITANTTLGTTHNHMSIGPIEIAENTEVVVESGASWSIV
jgi:hypothetical protein